MQLATWMHCRSFVRTPRYFYIWPAFAVITSGVNRPLKTAPNDSTLTAPILPYILTETDRPYIPTDLAQPLAMPPEPETEMLFNTGETFQQL